jgi:outer membrane protein assembly factor BamB
MQSLRFRSPLAILVFAVLTSICTARAAEPRWPGWRGPNRDGKSPDTGLLKTWPADGPKQLWKVTGIGQGFSSVSFGGGLLYTTGRKEAGDPAKVPQAEHVFKRTGDRLYLKALDMEGKVKWSKDVGEAYVRSYKGSRATPTYDDGSLYLECGIGMVGCYDAQTGKEKWTRKFSEFEGKVGGYNWGYSESVLIVGDLAVVSPGGKCFMVALNKSTGETVWQSEGFGPAQYSSPIHVVYQDVPMIINGSHKGLIAVHAKTGKTLWTQEFAKDNVASVPTPAFADGYVFWAAGYGQGGICLKLSASGGQVTATEAWRTDDMDCHHGGYVIVDGYIYGNHREKWTCLELKSGNKKWEAKGVGKGSVCWADGMLYLFGEKNGKAALATCAPNGLEMKGALQVSGEGPSWAHPVVAGGRLYLRYDDNLYCFDVTPQQEG